MDRSLGRKKVASVALEVAVLLRWPLVEFRLISHIFKRRYRGFCKVGLNCRVQLLHTRIQSKPCFSGDLYSNHS